MPETTMIFLREIFPVVIASLPGAWIVPTVSWSDLMRLAGHKSGSRGLTGAEAAP